MLLETPTQLAVGSVRRFCMMEDVGPVLLADAIPFVKLVPETSSPGSAACLALEPINIADDAVGVRACATRS